MKERWILCLCLTSLAAGCSLQEPCKDNELYAMGECIKCRDYGGHHVDEHGMCVKDTLESCGDGMVDCTQMLGVAEAECQNGTCQILRCREQDGYRIDANRCLMQDIYECGADKKNCMTWLSRAYTDATWADGSTPVCMQGQCAVGDCAYGFLHITCGEYHAQYEADYREKYGDAFRVPLCAADGSDDIKFCMKSICEPVNPMPGAVSKVVPGVCGCDLAEDTGDNDRDGVINCHDACPDNPTKSDKAKWWDETNRIGIDCDIPDTDRDGVDDAHDACPTRADIQTAEDAGYLPEGKTQNEKCRIETTGEDGIPEFHIYNAADLVQRAKDGSAEKSLRDRLGAIHNEIACTDEKDTIRWAGGKCTMRSCIHGIWHDNKCSQCTWDSNSQNYICKDQEEIPLTPKLRITLENDINLDDAGITILSKQDNEAVCYGVWASLPILTLVEFDGKGNTISYHHGETRCKLFDSLIGNITLSKVQHFNLDYDMEGYGRALFANQIDSSEVRDMEIVGGTMQSNQSGKEGYGSLFGVVESNQTDTTIEDIVAEHLRVKAPNASNVGGLFGIVTETNKPITLRNIRLTLDEIEGVDYVGGMIGMIGKDPQAEGELILSDIQSEVQNVKGNNYTGGLGGQISSVQMSHIQQKNQTIEGNSYVGGFAGSISNCKGTDPQPNPYRTDILVRNQSVHGTTGVGGFAGYCSDFASTMMIKVESDTIEGNAGVGGALGSGSFSDTTGISIFQNKTQSVKGGEYTGGFVGDATGVPYYNTTLFWIYNDVGTVEGTKYVGGAIGGIVQGAAGNNVSGIYNRVGAVSGNNHVGGLAGDLQSYEIFVHNVINVVESVSNLDKTDGGIGGLVGTVNVEYNTLSLINIFNKVNEIKADNYAKAVGGLIGLVEKSGNELRVESVHSEIEAMHNTGDYLGGLYGLANEAFTLTMQHTSLYSNITRGTHSCSYGLIGGWLSQNNPYMIEDVIVATSIYEEEHEICTGLIDGGCQYNQSALQLFSPCLHDTCYTSITEGPSSYTTMSNICTGHCTGSSDPDCYAHCANYWSTMNYSLAGTIHTLPTVKSYVLNALKGLDIHSKVSLSL